MSNIGYWIVESSAAFVVYRADLSFVQMSEVFQYVYI